MGTAFEVTEPLPQEPVPPLQNGDRLTRPEFERRYWAMPHLKKAELIDGRVYLGPPVDLPTHGMPSAQAISWLGIYRAFTPDVIAGAHSTVRLDWHNEAQPDALLMLPLGRSGQAQLGISGFVEGAPELIVEVAASSASYDLHDKKLAYERSGVREYMAWRVLDREIDWFVLREGRYARLAPGSDGVIRSEVFPGLWLDPAALLAGDLARVYQVAQEGIASPEHAAFVQ
jgi:Uma2 family endonuclease